MATVYQCDKCGKIMPVDKDHVQHFILERFDGAYSVKSESVANFDLCDDCLNKMLTWLTTKKETPTNENDLFKTEGKCVTCDFWNGTHLYTYGDCSCPNSKLSYTLGAGSCGHYKKKKSAIEKLNETTNNKPLLDTLSTEEVHQCKTCGGWHQLNEYKDNSVTMSDYGECWCTPERDRKKYNDSCKDWYKIDLTAYLTCTEPRPKSDVLSKVELKKTCGCCKYFELKSTGTLGWCNNNETKNPNTGERTTTRGDFECINEDFWEWCGNG